MRRLLLLLFAVLWLPGCSVILALEGEEPRDYAAFRAGTEREQVLAKFGEPDSTVTQDGGWIDTYKLEEGDESSPDRAAVHILADMATLGAWELVGTPLEWTKGEDVTYTITYGPDGKVKSVTPIPPGPGLRPSYLSGTYAASPVSVPPTTASLTSTGSDVDEVPWLGARQRPTGHAVVIGIKDYRDALPEADYADHDAEIVAKYMTKTLGYPEENVAVLLNDRATRADFGKYIESWLPNRVEPNDTVFVYFSGHGAPSPKTQAAYLVPYDGDPVYIDKTGYALSTLYEHLSSLPAEQVVVVLDSCFSGAGGRSVIATGMRPIVLSVENPLLAEGRVVVLGASAAHQVSNTYAKEEHGLLTYFFLKGLGGDGDENGDGIIELSELYWYLKPQVERTARREFNNEQVPQLTGNPDLLARGVRLLER